MSGSVTTARVALTPAELERQARERGKRERERQLRERFSQTIAGVRAVTVNVRAPAQWSEQAGERSDAGSLAKEHDSHRATNATAQAHGHEEERGVNLALGRDVDEDRVATPRAGAQPDTFTRPDPPAQPEARQPPDAPETPASPTLAAVSGEVRAFALGLADEARHRGFSALAEDAEAVQDEVELLAVERALDDAIDAAATAAVVEARVDAAVHAVLGDAWTPQPDAVGQRRVSAAGDTIRSLIEVEDGGTALVEMVVDARAPAINGHPSGTCNQENRITTALFGEMESRELEVVEAPTVARRAATRLGGLVSEATNPSTRATRAREARRT